MRFWAPLVLTVPLVAGVPSGAPAETPAEFLKRVIVPPIQRFEQMVAPPGAATRATALPKATQPADSPLTQPADTPLLAVPLPRLRPADDGDAALGFVPDATAVAIPTEDLPPMPRLRDPSAAAKAAVALIPPNSDAEPLIPLSELAEPPPAAQSTCGVSLAMLGVTAIPMEAIDQGACGMAAPVQVAALDGGAIDIRGKAVVNCTMAETFATWMDETVGPLAYEILSAPVTSVRVAAGYDCRGRNGVKGAQLSEHGKGNAIDIAAFEVEGHGWIEVGKAGGAGGEFLAAVRKAACGPFKTVLGPGSDAYHSDHFHLDLAERRNGSKYCR